MTREDARTIFNNVAELAVFADEFSEALEEALGNVLEGGKGEDYVGRLFLSVVRTSFSSAHCAFVPFPPFRACALTTFCVSLSAPLRLTALTRDRSFSFRACASGFRFRSVSCRAASPLPTPSRSVTMAPLCA